MKANPVIQTKKMVTFLPLYPKKPINTPMIKRTAPIIILVTNLISLPYLSFMTQACLQDPSIFKILSLFISNDTVLVV